MMTGDAHLQNSDAYLMTGDAQPHHVNLPLQAEQVLNSFYIHSYGIKSKVRVTDRTS